MTVALHALRSVMNLFGCAFNCSLYHKSTDSWKWYYGNLLRRVQRLDFDKVGANFDYAINDVPERCFPHRRCACANSRINWLALPGRITGSRLLKPKLQMIRFARYRGLIALPFCLLFDHFVRLFRDTAWRYTIRLRIVL